MGLLKESRKYFGDESWVAFLILSMHGVGFSSAGLSVGEDGGVVSFEGFIDEVIDLALVI